MFPASVRQCGFMDKQGKIIIISAPSGCGKSTIINAINQRGNVDMQFSVSATNRPPRAGEIDGVNYHFLTDDQFKAHITGNDFIEYEEVYPGRFYGTLKSEIDSRILSGQNVVLDIDVRGGANVKSMYGDDAISIFILPPSIDALRDRLTGRGTETQQTLADRLNRAEYELTFAHQFDVRVVNDNLSSAVEDVERAIVRFLDR